MNDIIALLVSVITVVVTYFVVKTNKRYTRQNYEELESALRERAKLWIRPHKKRKKPTKIKVLDKRLSEETNLTCPLCQDNIDSGVHRCKECGVIYHSDCLEELSAGKCATLGCKRQIMRAKA